jgi:hypothetical protein
MVECIQTVVVCVTMPSTGSSKSLCAPDGYNTESYKQCSVSPASLQTFIDTPNCIFEDRVLYSTVHIPNVFCDGHLQIVNCVGIVRILSFCVFLFCNHQVHRDFVITLYFDIDTYKRFRTAYCSIFGVENCTAIERTWIGTL